MPTARPMAVSTLRAKTDTSNRWPKATVSARPRTMAKMLSTDGHAGRHQGAEHEDEDDEGDRDADGLAALEVGARRGPGRR